ncbi:MAG TPA: sensor histidine kinase [Acidimicrobiales bacterium]|nr:sensor histidine kinase [Acidimicrobiales bacterium]
MTETLDRQEGRRSGPGADSRRSGFRHEAFFYAGMEDFAEGVASFVRGGLDAGEPVMVALRRGEIELVRRKLGNRADDVAFVDMAQLGRNPARIIPAWRQFVAAHPDEAVRGVGEPIWSGRSHDEVEECQLYETLLDVALGDPADGFWLLCPYDVDLLDAAVLGEARRSHPYVAEGGHSGTNPSFRSNMGAVVLDTALAPPSGDVHELEFDEQSLPAVRRSVTEWAGSHLTPEHTTDMVLAVHEIATNSIRHGGGAGRLRCWMHEGAMFVCEVSDAGRFERPLVGRVQPPTDDEVGRGLWLANQLCELVQVRSGPEGTVVRLHSACHGRDHAPSAAR